MKRIAQLVVPVLLAFAGVSHAATPAVPITSTGPVPTLPTFSGHAAVARPVPDVGRAWQDPFMAPNPSNSVHNDAWASDDYTTRSGPLGRHLTTLSTAIGRDCITLAFNHQGQLIGTCTDLSHGPGLYLLDPNTLATLAFLQLPFVPPPAGTNPATNTTGGAYFYLDNHDRVVVAASNRRILVVAVVHHGGHPRSNRSPTTTRRRASRPAIGCRPCSRTPRDGCGSSVAIRAPSACSIPRPVAAARSSSTRRSKTRSRSARRRLHRDRQGDVQVPRGQESPSEDHLAESLPQHRHPEGGTVQRRVRDDADSHRLTGDARPTATAQYVAITDNADPLDVVVYRTPDRLGAHQRRVVCQVPVFRRGASADENSLISMGRSLIVENNAGYDLTKFNDVIAGGITIRGELGTLSSPGMDRIDIDKNGAGCHIVWRNTTIRTPSAVSKGDAANGLIYTYRSHGPRSARGRRVGVGRGRLPHRPTRVATRRRPRRSVQQPLRGHRAGRHPASRRCISAGSVASWPCERDR